MSLKVFIFIALVVTINLVICDKSSEKSGSRGNQKRERGRGSNERGYQKGASGEASGEKEDDNRRKDLEFCEKYIKDRRSDRPTIINGGWIIDHKCNKLIFGASKDKKNNQETAKTPEIVIEILPTPVEKEKPDLSKVEEIASAVEAPDVPKKEIEVDPKKTEEIVKNEVVNKLPQTPKVDVPDVSNAKIPVEEIKNKPGLTDLDKDPKLPKIPEVKVPAVKVPEVKKTNVAIKLPLGTK